ncbi:hypothetical protein MTO96_001075 [Rhipicephalus appendiculatus]
MSAGKHEERQQQKRNGVERTAQNRRRASSTFAGHPLTCACTALRVIGGNDADDREMADGVSDGPPSLASRPSPREEDSLAKKASERKLSRRQLKNAGQGRMNGALWSRTHRRGRAGVAISNGQRRRASEEALK